MDLIPYQAASNLWISSLTFSLYHFTLSEWKKKKEEKEKKFKAAIFIAGRDMDHKFLSSTAVGFVEENLAS